MFVTPLPCRIVYEERLLKIIFKICSQFFPPLPQSVPGLRLNFQFLRYRGTISSMWQNPNFGIWLKIWWSEVLYTKISEILCKIRISILLWLGHVWSALCTEQYGTCHFFQKMYKFLRANKNLFYGMVMKSMHLISKLNWGKKTRKSLKAWKL